MLKRPEQLARIGWLLVLLCATLACEQRSQTAQVATGDATRKADYACRILSAQGGVEYRRGETGAWTKARSGDGLSWGDWIKTASDGVATVRFADGATCPLEPDTLVRLNKLADRSLSLETIPELDHDWVISDQPIEPRPAEGPTLLSPSRDHEIDLAIQKQLRLAWEGVPAASHYALNISRSRSFKSNIIEDTARREPTARIGIRGEGVFFWRVAAFRRDGSQGAWSEIRSFRVADPGNIVNQG